MHTKEQLYSCVEFVLCLETFTIIGIHFIKHSKNEKFWGQQLDASPLQLQKISCTYKPLFEIACQNLI